MFHPLTHAYMFMALLISIKHVINSGVKVADCMQWKFLYKMSKLEYLCAVGLLWPNGLFYKNKIVPISSYKTNNKLPVNKL